MKDRINQPFGPQPDKLAELKKFSDEQLAEHGVHHYVLDESGNVVGASLIEWCFWLERNGRQRVIQQDYPKEHKVSTIFTGLNMSYNPKRPLFFETMVFGLEEPTEWLDGTKKMMRPSLWTERCRTLREALEMHKRGLEWLDNYLIELETKKE